jgi:hypothetical protein
LIDQLKNPINPVLVVHILPGASAPISSRFQNKTGRYLRAPFQTPNQQLYQPKLTLFVSISTTPPHPLHKTPQIHPGPDPICHSPRRALHPHPDLPESPTSPTRPTKPPRAAFGWVVAKNKILT